MRRGEARGSQCQSLGHPVFCSDSRKQVLTGAPVSTIPQRAQFGFWAGEELGQAACSSGSSVPLWEGWWFPVPRTQLSWVHRRCQSPTLDPCAVLEPQPAHSSGSPSTPPQARKAGHGPQMQGQPPPLHCHVWPVFVGTWCSLSLSCGFISPDMH